MRTKSKKQRDDWQILPDLIAAYAAAVVADSWKGGGDPADYPVIEAELELAKAKLETHIAKLRRQQ